MKPKELFDIWAPEDATWSVWAKPVLFAVKTDSRVVGLDPQVLPNTSEWKTHAGDTALIINLPGVDSILFGLSLTDQGFRPIPLFNAADGPSAHVDVKPIAAALAGGAEILQRAILGPDAPPAFLLDARRFDGRPIPGQFDNRWVVFPQDFPSGIFMQFHGIRRVAVIQGPASMDRDLAQVLALWKRSGLEIVWTHGTPTEMAAPNNLRPVSRFNLMRTAFAAMLIGSFGLHRSNAGGFGSIIPEPGRGG